MRTLFEEDDIVGIEAKVVVLLEELLGGLACGARRHNVPGHNSTIGQILQTLNALGLDLEEGLVAR